MRAFNTSRTRKEFLHLEDRLEPDFIDNAWNQFTDGILHGRLPTRSYQSQFRLLAQIERKHARRDRYNARRRSKRLEKKLEAFLGQWRPQYLGYLITGVVKFADGMSGQFDSELSIGALCGDVRLSRKFLFRMETIHEMFYPEVSSHMIDRQRARAEKESPIPQYDERRSFETLLATQAPRQTSAGVIPFCIPGTTRRITETEEKAEAAGSQTA